MVWSNSLYLKTQVLIFIRLFESHAMKIYFGEFLVRQHCFHLPYGCMIFFVSHYYCLSPPVQRVLLLSLYLFLCSLRSADHLAYVSAVILTNLSMTCLWMVGMCILSWRTLRIIKKSNTTLYWIKQLEPVIYVCNNKTIMAFSDKIGPFFMVKKKAYWWVWSYALICKTRQFSWCYLFK